jgi:uncharacterized protein YdaU (DUF1376 family)
MNHSTTKRLPWFKLFAADYLLDSDVDSMPREAEGLLLRMWAICHIEGSCPNDPEELARKTRCSLNYVLKYKPYCDPFYEVKNERLYSHRMEQEKRRSEQARANVSKRYEQSTSEIGSSNGTTVCTTQNQSQIQRQNKVKTKTLSSLRSEEEFSAARNQSPETAHSIFHRHQLREGTSQRRRPTRDSQSLWKSLATTGETRTRYRCPLTVQRVRL